MSLTRTLVSTLTIFFAHLFSDAVLQFFKALARRFWFILEEFSSNVLKAVRAGPFDGDLSVVFILIPLDGRAGALFEPFEISVLKR